MAQKPVARGRGALLEMLKKHKEGMAGGGDSAEDLPPKSRGRAALLRQLQAAKEQKAGGSKETHAAVAEPTLSTVPPRREVERLSSGVSELSLATPSETVSFRGTQGTPINVAVNYVFLEIEKDRGVFEYEVRFDPDVDARSYRVKLVNEILGAHGKTKVFDGGACLYLPAMIYPDTETLDTVLPNTDVPVRVTLIYKRKKNLKDCLHLYNVLFKRIMRILLYHRMGRNYFSPEHKHIVPQHKLEVLPGFAVHVDEMEGGLMLCLDTQHKVIRSQTVHELLEELSAHFPRTFKEEARKNIIGVCVLTKYNNMTYTIDDIAWNVSPKDSFKSRNGSECTFIDYYRQHYNLHITDHDQPMLIHRRKKKDQNGETEEMVCLVPELSYVTGLSDALREDFKVMKDVAAFTRVTPDQRALALRTYLERVNNSEDARNVLACWGLKLSRGMTDFQARVLPSESIHFGGGGEARQFGDWNKAMGENRLTGPIDIQKWQLYYTRRDQRYASSFAENMVRFAKGMGCIIRDPQHVMLDDDRTDTYMTAIKNNVRQDTQVAVFVCPTIRTDRYSIIKKMCCINLPMASQVVLSKTLSNQQKVRTITHKIALQITCKLGGTLWCVKIPVSGWMVCGIDVYHGPNKQSVCGFVSSINDAMTKYYSEAMFQDGEIGNFFKMAFTKSLMNHRERTGSFPAKVVIFRDGVGDGQLEHSRRYEVSQLVEVIKELKIETTITFVVVQKRINTRILKVSGTKYENPPSGTVVDSIVTRKTLADFYLVPQSVRQGTVNPTHYIVVYDDGGIKPDHLQRLAYKLCHLYYNWSGPIRVPAPCLYAHKLAALVGQYIKKIPAGELNDKLYYL